MRHVLEMCGVRRHKTVNGVGTIHMTSKYIITYLCALRVLMSFGCPITLPQLLKIITTICIVARTVINYLLKDMWGTNIYGVFTK